MKECEGMKKDITFHNCCFEENVQSALSVFNRPLIMDDIPMFECFARYQPCEMTSMDKAIPNPKFVKGR